MPRKVWETLHAWDCGAHRSCLIMHFFAQIVFALPFLLLISVFACIFMCKVAPLVYVLTSENVIGRVFTDCCSLMIDGAVCAV